jgi:hypothetical protein
MWGLRLPTGPSILVRAAGGRPVLIVIWGVRFFIQGERKQYCHYLTKIYSAKNICLAENNVRIVIEIIAVEAVVNYLRHHARVRPADAIPLVERVNYRTCVFVLGEIASTFRPSRRVWTRLHVQGCRATFRRSAGEWRRSSDACLPKSCASSQAEGHDREKEQMHRFSQEGQKTATRLLGEAGHR